MKVTLSILTLVISICSFSKDTLFVGLDETVILIFHSEIVEYDAGQLYVPGRHEEGILVEYGKRKNELKVKAGIERFYNTNLHIRTEKGFYEFLCVYHEHPEKTTFVMSLDRSLMSPEEMMEIYGDEDINANSASKSDNGHSKKEVATFETNCSKVFNSKKNVHDIGLKSPHGSVLLTGLYYADNHLYFKVELTNTSVIPYDVELIKFASKEKIGVFKRKATENEILEASFIDKPDQNRVEENETLTKVFVFEKFTLAKDKKVVIEFWEKEGDRISVVKLPSNLILKADHL